MSDKIYIENPYLKDLKAKVISKEKKDEKYYVILNRTIFYPRNSNSINIDKGTIDDIDVVNVFEEDGKVVHVLEEDICSKDINMEIDWNMRFDYMQQHTGGHILSTSANKLCGANTMKIHCDRDCSYISIDFKELSSSDVGRIERFANQMIYSNFQINSSILKEDGENKRTVSIDNISTDICKGLHCSNTGEVGIIKIIDFRKNEDDNVELKFICGNRALKDYSSLYETVKDILEKNKELEEQIKEFKNTKASNI